MKSKIIKIGFGGGCHWCTEAIFQSLIGVEKVEQGFIASTQDENTYSEAVIVHYDVESISLEVLMEIHLHTHKSTSNHSMRKKYRSAIYTFSNRQKNEVINYLADIQKEFKDHIITKVLPFGSFKISDELFQNYYYTNPQKPFCETYINPKLTLLMNKYAKFVHQEKVNHLHIS